MSVAVGKRPGATSLVQAQSAPAPAATPGKQTLTEQLPAPAATYTVQPGDTLPGIATKLRTTVDALKAANLAQLKSFPTRSGGVVQGFNAGAVLNVPGATASPAAPAAAASPATTTPAPGAAPAASGGIVDSLVSALEGAWESFTGSSSTPATDPAAAPGTGTGTPSPAASAPAGSAPATGAAPAAPTGSASPPLADVSDAQRGQQLSTFSPGEVPKDPTQRPDDAAGAAQKRGQWLSTDQVAAAGTGKSGDAFVASIDEMNAGARFTADQNQMIAAARDFAAAPRPLTPAQEAKAAMDWSKAKLTLDGITLNADLEARVTRFVRFAAWAGLVTGPTPVNSVMRSPADAHLWSVAWMFNVEANTNSPNTLHKASHRQQLVKNVTDRGGTDADGHTWLSPTTVEGLKSRKDDDAALFEYIKTTAAADAAKVKTFPNQAAEGYTTADKRHPNVFPGSKVSNHLTGEAVDMSPPWVFNNKYDPVIDAMAAYFGLSRPLKDSSNPEHWHFERLGTPPGAEEEEAH